MTVNEDQIRRFLERYGKALSAGDLAGISSCWEIPGLVLADDGVVAFADKGQIESFAAHALEWYQSRGLTATRPELGRVEARTERLTFVEVRWPSFDDEGVERSSEWSHYILRLGDDGEQRIHVALTEPLSHPD
jgi:hypothetical protein